MFIYPSTLILQSMTLVWTPTSIRQKPERETTWSWRVKSCRVHPVLPFSTKFLGSMLHVILPPQISWWSLTTRACWVTQRTKSAETCRDDSVSPDLFGAASLWEFRGPMWRIVGHTSARWSNTSWIRKDTGSKRPQTEQAPSRWL